MNRILFISCVLFLTLRSANVAAQLTLSQVDNDSIKFVITRLNQALNSKSIDAVAADLHADFSVSVVTAPKSLSYLHTLLRNDYLKSISFKDVDFVYGDIIFVRSDAIDKKGDLREGLMAFDARYKLLYVDFFDQAFTPSRYGESRHVADIPFEVINNSIVLNLRLNDSDKRLRLLFDTGADGMALVASVAEEIGVKATREQETMVVGGSMQIRISPDNTVHLSDSLVLRGQNIALFQQMGHDGLDGIIGLNLAYHYIVHVDFDRQLLSLYTFGTLDMDSAGGTVIDVTVPEGTMRVPAVLNIAGKGDVSGSFVFDTGANYYLICFEQFVRKNRLLLTGFKPEGQGTTVSMGKSTPVYHGKAYSFSMGGVLNEQMPVTLQTSTGREIKPGEAAGSIGVQLISNYNFTIDLLRKKLLLNMRHRQ